MALFMKQDFTPTVLSRKWISMKFRPNMLIHSREHIITILESGLLFREDSIEVEQEAPSFDDIRDCSGWKGGFTRGERIASVLAVSACLLAFPPRNLHRWTVARVVSVALVPLAVRRALRRRGSGSLGTLCSLLRDYLALARRAAACCRDLAALHAALGSVTTAVQSMHALLCRQQSELAVMMSRASSALLGNAPWLRGDVAWEAVPQEASDNLVKIHHAFLVVQSTLLKHIAMAHHIPTVNAKKIYRNHNERVYWIHTVLIEHLIEEFRENYEALERMYRLLKNFGNKDSESAAKKPGSAISDSWLYSDVHTGVARTCLELKLALNKCNTLDIFLDSCALNKQNLDLQVLDKDIEDLIDNITSCLTTVQSSQIRLKKLQGKVKVAVHKDEEDEIVEEDKNILRIEDKVPEAKDEVFYFVKTDGDDTTSPVGDILTAPGVKEKETSKVVLNELKRKLVKREDFMRERERQALKKTMPEFKDNVPEFPRQIKIEEFVDRQGFISKLSKPTPKQSKLFRHYKISKTLKDNSKGSLVLKRYTQEGEINGTTYDANAKLSFKSKLVTVSVVKGVMTITRWCKVVQRKEMDSSGMSDGLSDVEAGAANDAIHQAFNTNNRNSKNESKNCKGNREHEAKNFRFSRRDLELTPSSSDSDYEDYMKRERALLNDVRRHRAARKKNHPVKRSVDVEDESLKPIEYSFGTGMAMAAVLQVNNKAKIPTMAQEEVFIGDGEVSDDSGNSEED